MNIFPLFDRILKLDRESPTFIKINSLIIIDLNVRLETILCHYTPPPPPPPPNLFLVRWKRSLFADKLKHINQDKTDLYPRYFQVKSFLVLTKWVDRCALVPPCVELSDRPDYHPGTDRRPFVVHQLYEFGNTKKITWKGNCHAYKFLPLGSTNNSKLRNNLIDQSNFS